MLKVLARSRKVASTQTNVLSWSVTRGFADKQHPSIDAESESHEAFYQFFLKKKVYDVDSRKFTGRWLTEFAQKRSPDASRRPLQEDLLAMFSNSSLDLDSATEALSLYVEQLHRKIPEREQTRLECLHHRPGTKALFWYLNSAAYQNDDRMLDVDFLKPVVHCLVAEQKDEHVWDLLNSWAELDSKRKPSERPANLWKGAVLEHLVNAHMFWAEKSKAFAKGFEAYSRASQGVLSGAPEKYMDLTKSWQSLARYLRVTKGEVIQGRQFKRFRNMAGIWSTGREEARLDISYLDVKHPTNPDPEPVLTVLREWSSSGVHGRRLQLHFTPDSRGAQRTYVMILQIAQLLERKGRFRDARWVLDFGKSQLPGLFNMRFVPKRNTPYERPEMRRYPTASEIDRGVELDDSGYVVKDGTSSQLRSRYAG